MPTAEAPEAELHSALARELQRIPPAIRRRFGVPDIAIPIIEFAVELTRSVLETGDWAVLESKFNELEPRLERFAASMPSDQRLKAWARWATCYGPDYMQRYVKRFGTGKGFLLRLLGAAHYHRLSGALAEDGGILLLAARRLMRYFMPFATALDDVAAVLPQSKKSIFKGLADQAQPYLSLFYSLDQKIDELVASKSVPFEDLPFREDEQRALDIGVDILTKMLRQDIEAETLSHADGLSDILGRKLRGFADALHQSADGVSQAANSIVEFIDRLLRTAFSEKEVLTWVQQHAAENSDLLYSEHSGRSRPTKLAQAMCFVHAGAAPVEEDEWKKMVALGIVEVRRKSEKIKHSDAGTDQETAELLELMNALRGFFIFSIRFSWAIGNASNMETLRERFAPAA